MLYLIHIVNLFYGFMTRNKLLLERRWAFTNTMVCICITRKADIVCLIFIIFTFVNCDERKKLKLSFLSSTSDLRKEGSLQFAGAFFTALEFINTNSSILEGYRLEFLFNDTHASSLNAINAMTSQYGNDTIGFIGPDESCQCESTVAAAWNLPMLGYVSFVCNVGWELCLYFWSIWEITKIKKNENNLDCRRQLEKRCEQYKFKGCQNIFSVQTLIYLF